jgi:hypothetical protein
MIASESLVAKLSQEGCTRSLDVFINSLTNCITCAPNELDYYLSLLMIYSSKTDMQPVACINTVREIPEGTT